jgi:hypothetical protein
VASAIGAFHQGLGDNGVDKSVAYLDIDDTGLAEAGYGPQV